MTRFLSYMWSCGLNWKTLLFYLMPRSQYRLWRKMKSPHWVLHISPTPAGSSLLGTPTFTAGSNPDHWPSPLLALPSHLIMSQEYQKVLLQQFTGRSLRKMGNGTKRDKSSSETNQYHWLGQLFTEHEAPGSYGDLPLLPLKLNVPPLYQSLGFHCRVVVLPISINLCPTRA